MRPQIPNAFCVVFVLLCCCVAFAGVLRVSCVFLQGACWCSVFSCWVRCFFWEEGFSQLKVAPKDTQNTFTQSWRFKLDQQSLVSDEMTRKSLSSGEAEFYVLNSG